MSTRSGRSIAMLSALAGVGERAVNARDLPNLYSRVVQIGLAELQADCAALMLWDGQSDHLSVAAVGGLSPIEAETVPLGSSLAGWVVTRCEPIIVEAAASGPDELFTLLRCNDVRAAVGVPLIGQGRVLGVLAAAHQRDRAGFTVADRDLLALLAGQAAIAIERVQLRATLMRDAGDRQQGAQRLAQTEKLAGMGRLAASIAHEINNPLQAIHNSLHLLLNRPLPDDKRTRYLGMAQDQVERLVSLVQRMLNFSQPVRDGMRLIPLYPVLEQVLRAEAERCASCNIQIERDWAEGLPRVMGIASHLKQVFHNLTLNAIEAMPDGGRLVVRTCVIEATDDSGARSVLIEFSDDGPGIPDSELQAIFEPFYTTKSNGTGLGLAISYSIIEQHGGALSVRSDGGQTTFRILLPAWSGTSGSPELLAPNAAAEEMK